MIASMRVDLKFILASVTAFLIMGIISFSGYIGLYSEILPQTKDVPPLEPPTKLSAKPDKPAFVSEEVKSLKKALVKLRNLKFKKDIPVGVKTREELKQMMLADFNEDKPDLELEKIRKALNKFGLLPPDLNIGKFMRDLLTEQIGGFYDPQKKELTVVIKGTSAQTPLETRQLETILGVSMTHITIIHELTHVLQDQYFDLLTLPLNDPDNDDLATAVKSVAEGEATYTMYAYPLSRLGLDMALMPDITQGIETMSFGGSGLIDKAPLYIKEGLLFPYIAGLYFIRRVKAQGGWAGVDKLYADLPASTEQIIHPKKYLDASRDYPVSITLPPLTRTLTGSRWKHLLTNVMGELNVRILFKEFLPNLRPKRIAAGWDGDQFVVFEHKPLLTPKEDADSESAPASGTFPEPITAIPVRLLVWYTTWDTLADSDQFYQGYRLLIEKKYPSAKLNEETETSTIWRNEKGLVYIEKRDLDVLIIETVPPELLKSLVALIWENTQKTELKKVARVEPRKKAKEEEKEVK